MKTSHKTRKYWADKALGWAENFLTHPDYDGSPQLDEFRAVMDDLLEASEIIEGIMEKSKNKQGGDVMMAYEELKAKYPEIHHAPRKGCKYCGGTGEKTTHLKKSEFFEEHDVTSPCICLFVDHEYVDEIQQVLNKTIAGMKEGEK